MNSSKLVILGRALIALLFVPAGISKIFGFAGTVGYITSVGLPLPTLAAIGAIVVEVGAGLALLAGYRTQLVALILAAFTLVAAVVFHNFWAAPAEMAQMQQIMFFKNIAVVGGLLILSAFPSTKNN
ncbi:Inner membrane protein YphA [Ephemeroptericola cinctiostellae]|uniref:Inner membrane protein YphA n=1 Tax=Ephemeroptericola cinctiostellae TaxID=2268024 RepID=A0A345D9D1_9BURK|nr:DoxX family protein [Ephemeroptericola cinctiostellae]AXF84969.1 Inner membrane protein YphA [Ephemeroptericola cinctiostellae]